MARVSTNRSQSVRVEGLAELSRALRKLEDAEGSKELRAAFKGAADSVIRDARSGGDRMQASMASRLKASVGRASAAVVIGGKPYDLGAEFGANQNVPRSTKRGTVLGWNQFQPHRGNGENAGYVVMPAARAARDRLPTDLGDAIGRLWDHTS